MLNDKKKLKYFVASAIFVFSLFGMSFFVTSPVILVYAVLFVLTLSIISLFYADALLIILLSHLFVGFLSTFYFFPNLGVVVKVIAFLAVGFVAYSTFLVNNVFLVVKEKGSLIPLYSAAVTWLQVLIIIISIPYFSAVYKIPTSGVVQNLLVFISTVLFIGYMIWSISFDAGIKKTNLIEKVYLALLLGFMVFVFGIGVSFIPSESFLRGLFISSLLLFCLTYVYGHYKNKLSKKLFFEYSLISLVFFIILLIFN